MSAHQHSAVQLAQQIQTGTTKAVDVLEASFAQIEACDAQVGAFLCLNKDQAFATAKAVDEAAAKGDTLSPLAGVPIAIKDNLNLTGLPTTCASQILQGYTSPYDATVVQRLKANQLPIVGKTNLDEFAMGSSTENSAIQLTRNPWDLERVPGGSSGGSAACVSAGMVPLSLGSDTGGSVRQPASLCGLVGLKPTYGRVSRYGLVAYASSLDQVSPFARSVEDLATVFQVIAGPDSLDSTTVKESAGDYISDLKKPVGSLKVGVIRELNGEGMQPEVQASFQASLEQFKAMGAEVTEVSVESIKEAIAAYYVLAPAEASSNLSRFDGIRYGQREEVEGGTVYDLFKATRSKGFGAEVKRRIMIGTFALSSGYYDAYYGKAQKARQLLIQNFNKAFAHVDILICPTSPTTAFKLGEKTTAPLSMYLSDVATIPVNLAGIPALNVPCGFDSQQLPIGLQLMGPRLSEARLLQVAHAFEQLVGLSGLIPEQFAKQALPA